jgi:hypothetical protein
LKQIAIKYPQTCRPDFSQQDKRLAESLNSHSILHAVVRVPESVLVTVNNPGTDETETSKIVSSVDAGQAACMARFEILACVAFRVVISS